MPGIMTSSRMTSGKQGVSLSMSSASGPFIALSISIPMGFRKLSSTVWLMGSSSTESTSGT
eukprot:436214-Pyramimonas_sp.AAC.1